MPTSVMRASRVQGMQNGLGEARQGAKPLERMSQSDASEPTRLASPLTSPRSQVDLREPESKNGLLAASSSTSKPASQDRLKQRGEKELWQTAPASSAVSSNPIESLRRTVKGTQLRICLPLAVFIFHLFISILVTNRLHNSWPSRLLPE